MGKIFWSIYSDFGAQKGRTALTALTPLIIKQWSCQNQIESDLNIRGSDTFYKFAYQITQMSIISPKEHTKSFLHTLLCFEGCKITKLSNYSESPLRLLLFYEILDH